MWESAVLKFFDSCDSPIDLHSKLHEEFLEYIQDAMRMDRVDLIGMKMYTGDLFSDKRDSVVFPFILRFSCEKSGYTLLKSQTSTTAERSYIVIKAGVIQYFDDDSLQCIKGTLQLTAASFTESISRNGRVFLTIVTPGTSHTYYMYFEHLY